LLSQENQNEAAALRNIAKENHGILSRFKKVDFSGCFDVRVI